MVNHEHMWIVEKAYETENCTIGGFAVIAAVDNINHQVAHPSPKFKNKLVIFNIPEPILCINGKWRFLNEKQMRRFAHFIDKKTKAGKCKIMGQTIRKGDVIYAYVITKGK